MIECGIFILLLLLFLAIVRQFSMFSIGLFILCLGFIALRFIASIDSVPPISL
ncbi:MAG: hypothetical protein QF408_03055 [Pirellulales bacterium]|jgi:hypothetical protein|nr:hypothetical protein [Pirellulales bacterium]HJN66430.1 hypothetical protein [Pirellulales bacterium]|tara:strand:+ start:135 stop:293 length:159 start_codon:yes stop_codon:yes gene_type:complete